jgi:hypothetical protein
MPHQLLDQILPILYSVKDDDEKLEKILAFLQREIVRLAAQEEKIELPAKYEGLVNDIAQSLQAGLVCYLNLDMLETEEIPKGYLDDGWEDVEEDETFETKHRQWEHVLIFEPMESHESFRIMENFTEQLNNGKVKNKLIDILNHRKPFAHFNSFIHNSKFREEWFAYKNAAYEEHVRETLYDELHKDE